MNKHSVEFSGIRSQLYKEALQEYPEARQEDIQTMYNFLNPQKNETILEVGAGSGFFSNKIADCCQTLYVSDPSSEQLDAIHNSGKANIKTVQGGAEMIDLPENSVDAIRSFGAMHHCLYKTQAFENFAKALRPGGRLIIVDVLVGSDLAKHFDDKVAKYSITGHEVSYLSKEYFGSLCFVAGLKNPETKDLDTQWHFENKDDIGSFLYKLHAMTKTDIYECLSGAESILGVQEKKLESKSTYALNWPLTVFMATK